MITKDPKEHESFMSISLFLADILGCFTMVTNQHYSNSYKIEDGFGRDQLVDMGVLRFLTGDLEDVHGNKRPKGT